MIFDFFSARLIFISPIVNAKSSIFMSGEATRENAPFGVHECNKNQSHIKKVIFLFLLCFKIDFIFLMSQPLQQRRIFPSRFASSSMLPACLLGMVLK